VSLPVYAAYTATPREAESRRTTTWRAAVYLLCVVCTSVSLSLSSCSGGAGQAATQKAATSDVGKETVSVPVAAASRADLTNTVSLTAEFEPFQEVEVMAKVAGYVQEIRVDIGQRVNAGQVLAVLEVPELHDDVTRAVASVEQRAAEVSAAEDEVSRSESAYQIARISFERIQQVSKREPGLIAQQEIDEAQSRELMTKAQVAAAKSRLRVALQHLEVAKAEASRQRTFQRYITITAPFSGTITKRYANKGAMVQAGTASQSQAMPVVRLSQIDLLRLRLPVPESMVPAVRVGRPVEVRVNALGRTFQGKVARYTGKLDTGTRAMITEVDVPNPTGEILPGMYAEVTLGLDQREQVLSVPLEAIDRAGNATRVYLVDDSGAVRIVPVVLGLEDAHRVEIRSGLSEGDRVVVGQRSGLKEGQVVRAKLMETKLTRN
jgi:RND family efflux transporter MFP subunit